MAITIYFLLHNHSWSRRRPSSEGESLHLSISSIVLWLSHHTQRQRQQANGRSYTYLFSLWSGFDDVTAGLPHIKEDRAQYNTVQCTEQCSHTVFLYCSQGAHSFIHSFIHSRPQHAKSGKRDNTVHNNSPLPTIRHRLVSSCR
jgi:hypothetical protein